MSLNNSFKVVLLLGFLLITARIQAQISGVVIDSISSLPVGNINIRISGNEKGSSTSADGRFSIKNIESGWVILEFTHLAYVERKVKVYISDRQELPAIKLVPRTISLEDVVITSNRLGQRSADVPAAIYTIDGRQAGTLAVNNADELLMLIPGIRIDRDRGIFSKNSSINMRGLNGSQRTLVLLDGAPINKADGGGINWSRIDPDLIQKIEVIKGPASTIYGGNAMAGVVNIITNRQTGSFRARIKGSYGTFSTMAGSFSASGDKIHQSKGFYWSGYGYYRKGDGYIPVIDSMRDSLDVPAYLKETGFGMRVGYQFSAQSRVELSYDYFWDKRGDGTFVTEPGGSYNQYPTHFANLNVNSLAGKWLIDAHLFTQFEHYKRQNETIKRQNGRYTLYQTDSHRNDAGLWFTASRRLNGALQLLAGADVKRGSVDASDIYYTSTDILTNKGRMDMGALFSQLSMKMPDERFSLEAGLRFDINHFYNGSFEIKDPTSFSEFMTMYPSVFPDTTWHAFSPHLAFLFNLTESARFYASYGHGFRAPTLDDACRNGNITKGFKMANPMLGPEHLDNFEVGADVLLFSKIRWQQSVFMSNGRDFQYFIANGDSVYTGGNNLKPVLQRQNIARVRSYGTEISLSVPLSRNMIFLTNYAWNNATIVSSENSNGKSLEGKKLMEVPSNQFFAALEYSRSWMMVAINMAWTDEIFIDDDNLQSNPSYLQTGFRISANYHEKTWLSLSIQDVLNKPFVDAKGNQSPGRFVLVSLIHKVF